ncbi:hypothetical protein LJC27_04580 [Christensenellaceae bacterium OttesenSCG-928-M15]|nr:hypothetical protein [Christensenellaceae bacterium OttesenSCG-928-M15]
MKKRFIALLLTLVLLTGSIPASLAASTEEPADTFFTIQKAANAEREKLAKNASNLDISAYAKKDNTTAILSTAEIKALTSQNYDKGRTFTRAQALSDVDVLFRLYKSAYGPYYYFGEKNFEAAQAAIEKELNKVASIDKNEYAQLIAKNLNFMQDLHSNLLIYYPAELGGYTKAYYYAKDQSFSKDKTGYFKMIKGAKWYISSIDSKDASSYIRPTIQADGSIGYGLVQLATSANEAAQQKELLLKNAQGKTQKINLSWLKGANYAEESLHEPHYKYSTQSGVPVIEIRAMKGDEKGIQSFIQSGKQVKGKKTIILDFRSNGGGRSNVAADWFKNFTGKPAVITEASITRASKVLQAQGEFKQKSAGSWVSRNSKTSYVKNKTNIIALIDNNIGSAGESMIMYLRTLENVVFVGSNSSGCMLGMNKREFSLPETGLWVAFPIGLNMQEEAINRDGIGFEPDVWVNPKDAMALALKMVEYYQLA